MIDLSKQWDKSPFHVAIEQGDPAIVKVLIDANPHRNKSQIYLPYFDPNYADKR